jgi:peptidoglycan/xylan/chitin deacetylase (PgdA/CDA1 family)
MRRTPGAAVARRGKLRRGIDSALRRSTAQRVFLRRSVDRLVVLAYHGVDDPTRFADQMRHLCRTMHPVSLEEVVRAMAGRRRLPERAVLVTFDDGDPTVHDDGLPVLRDRGIPAVAFVIAGLLGTTRPCWWDEARELVRRGATHRWLPAAREACVGALKRMPDDRRVRVLEDLRAVRGDPPVRARQLSPRELLALRGGGVDIGNHTLTHPCLDRCNRAVIESEIAGAHDRLSEALGRPPMAFAYPNGNWDPRAEAILAELGYEAGFLFDHRIGAFPPPDRFRISRVRVSSTADPDRFRILVSGLHSAIHHLMGRP